MGGMKHTPKYFLFLTLFAVTCQAAKPASELDREILKRGELQLQNLQLQLQQQYTNMSAPIIKEMQAVYDRNCAENKLPTDKCDINKITGVVTKKAQTLPNGQPCVESNKPQGPDNPGGCPLTTEQYQGKP